MHRRGCRQLLLLSVLAASCFVALCASRTYVQIIGTPHIGDTLRERQAANDEWENGKEPFRPAEVLEALVARRHWSRTLEWRVAHARGCGGPSCPSARMSGSCFTQMLSPCVLKTVFSCLLQAHRELHQLLR